MDQTVYIFQESRFGTQQGGDTELDISSQQARPGVKEWIA